MFLGCQTRKFSHAKITAFTVYCQLRARKVLSLFKDVPWAPEGCCRHRHCTAIAPFWFSTEHLWILIAPFWLSTDYILCLIRPIRSWNKIQDKNCFCCSGSFYKIQWVYKIHQLIGKWGKKKKDLNLSLYWAFPWEVRHPPKFSNGSISKFILFLKFIALGIMQELLGLSFATLILFCDVSVKEYQNST